MKAHRALVLLFAGFAPQLHGAEDAHWAELPLRPMDPPPVRHCGWALTPLDRIVLARLEEAGLEPAPEAPPRKLLRRLSFDLTGLPPSPEDVESFATDPSAAAYERVVDRLLASPRFGEKWGRHWLDVARYADSNGMDENLAHGQAHRYRDYVLAAFNADKPYSTFVLEQLAGDLLPEPPTAAVRDERLAATGFLVIGPKMLAEDDPVKMEMDIVDEQVETVGRVFLGQTPGCARCHDHKFDPFTMADYYALAGIFKSTRTMDHFRVVARWHERPLASPGEIAAKAAAEAAIAGRRRGLEEASRAAVERLRAAARVQVADYLAAANEAEEGAALDAAAARLHLNPLLLQRWAQKVRSREAGAPRLTASDFEAFLVEAGGPLGKPAEAELFVVGEDRAGIERLRAEIKALEGALPVFPEVMAVEEGEPTSLRIHLRGSHWDLGREVARGLPPSWTGTASGSPGEARGSGRLELARWIASGTSPLPARVVANRIWRWLFGEGLVQTPDNFGRLGMPPSQPALLDLLALRLVEGGWSIKGLLREIVLSATYRQDSSGDPAAAGRDPENRLLGRHLRRRLEAEALRDLILAASGGLDLAQGGSLLKTADRAYVASTASTNATSYRAPRRSVYLPVVRSAVFEMLQAFDFADPSVSNGDRDTTTVPAQALCLLNSELVLEESLRLARRFSALALPSRSGIERIYLLLLGRPPTGEELLEGLAFLDSYSRELAPVDAAVGSVESTAAFFRALLATNEVCHVD